jgi:hypothetical protein
MTLAWLQLSYRQTEAYSFLTETAVAFITAKIVASLRDTACCHRNRRSQLQKAVTFYLCARTVYFSAMGTKAFCACAALESLLWFVTFWPICKELLIEISTDAADKDSFNQPNDCPSRSARSNDRVGRWQPFKALRCSSQRRNRVGSRLLFLAEFLESGIGAQRVPRWIEP